MDRVQFLRHHSGYTRAQFQAWWQQLERAWSSGATSLQLVGMEGTLDRNGIQSALAEYQAVLETWIAETSEEAAQSTAQSPRAITVNFGCRPIGF